MKSRLIRFSLLLLAVPALFWLSFRSSETPGSAASETRKTRQGAAQQLATRSKPALSLPAADPDEAAPAMDALQAFQSWVQELPPESGSEEELEIGIQLVQARAIEMKRLIREDPEEALRQAWTEAELAELPAEIRVWMEQPIHDSAAYEVVISCGGEHAPGEAHDDHVERTLLWRDQRLQTFTYGRRRWTTSKEALSVHGIALDGLAALHEDPVRVLDEEAKAFHGWEEEDLLAQVHGQLLPFASLEELASYRERLELREDLPDPRSAASPLEGEASFAGSNRDPVANSPFTEGAKTLLYIRARLSEDDPDYEPISVAQALSREAKVEEFFQKASYNKLSSWTVTVTDVVDLPNDSSYYNSRLSTLLFNGRTLAKDANPLWDYQNYDFYVVVTRNASFSYAGRANLGSRGAHLAGYTTLRTAGHEYGHNFGLWHSWYWRSDSESPIGRDSVPGGYVGDGNQDEDIEYGHFFDIMSAQSGSNMETPQRPHFSAYGKNHLDWLPDSEIEVVTSSQLVRMYTYDHPDTVGNPKAIHIDLPSNDYYPSFGISSNARRYWLQFRSQFQNTWASNGLQVDWNDPSGIVPTMIDMTPFSDDDPTGKKWTDDNSDKDDGILLIGRTYSDLNAPTDIHVTPIAKGGSGAEQYLDVQVYVGTAASNTAPEITSFSQSTLDVAVGESVDFNVTATDANGDPLVYAWYFGDNSLDPNDLNSSSVSHSWDSSGEYVVRTVVSDMKGGQASESVVVRVGDPSERYRIHGRVLWGGRPVENARVFIGNSYQARTDSDGSYVIADLPNASHNVECDVYGLSFTAQFTNPVDVGPDDAWAIDFYADDSYSGSGSVLTLRPYEVDIGLGDTQSFEATLWDASGTPTLVTPAWAVDGGGSVDGNGLFTPSAIGGPFTLSANQGGLLAESRIWVNGDMSISVVASDASAAENPADSGSFSFSRSGATSVPVEVFFSLSGSATEGLDYSSLPDSVIIPANSSSVSLDVSPLNDADAEGTESLQLTLSANAAYDLSEDNTASVDIADDDSVEQVFLISFSGSAYSTDGINSWQSFDVSTVDSGTGDPQHVNSALLVDTSGSSDKGILFSSSGGSAGTVSSPNSSVTAAMIPGNPFSWFDPEVAEQREVFTLKNGSNAWTFSLEGFDAEDRLVADFVFARDKTGDRAMTVTALSPGDILDDAQVDQDGGPQFPSSPELSGGSSYSFSLLPSGGGWGCLPNAMRLRVISPLAAAPLAPSDLVAAVQDSVSILLTWSDNSDNESGFMVQRSLTSGSGFSTVHTSSSDVHSFTDTVSPETVYYYQVLAAGSDADSEPSNEASASTKDSDVDGMLDDHELLAGSDPNNISSVFEMTAANPSSGDVAFEFPSASGSYYRVFYRDSMTEGSWQALPGYENMSGSGSPLQVEDSPSGTRFYKVDVQATMW